MSITFGGISSGLPVDNIVSQLIAIERRPIDLLAKRVQDLRLNDAQYKNTQDRASKLLASLKKLTAQSVLDEDLFRAKKGSTSNDSIATLSVDETAASQSMTLEVVKLASQTKAKSVSGVGQLTTGTSLINTVAQGNITDGTFTVFVNGVSNTVNVDVTQNIDSVLTQIAGISGITGASVVGGQIQLQYNSGTNVQLGANGDTSNFLDLTFMKTGTKTATSITSSIPLTTINLNQDVSTAGANLNTVVTDGTFTIGGATFDTTGKTLGELLTEINNSSDAGATASFNIAENKLQLFSTDSGSTLITLTEGTSNFLSAMGLVSAGDSTVSQTAGDNAEFKINGTTLYSATNTVNSGITGLTGITLELTGTNVGSTIDLSVTQDLDPLKTQINDFITNFNNLMSFIDTQTDSQNTEAKLSRESGLRRFRNELRETASDLVSGLVKYSSMGLVGISTGAVTTGGEASSQLVFNETLFDKAFADDPEQVRTLMIGTSGILTRLQSVTDAALEDGPSNTEDGLFAGHATTIQDRIKDLNDQIAAGEERLERREQFLRQQFNIMDQLIAQSQSQGNALNGLISQLNSSNQ